MNFVLFCEEGQISEDMSLHYCVGVWMKCGHFRERWRYTTMSIKIITLNAKWSRHWKMYRFCTFLNCNKWVIFWTTDMQLCINFHILFCLFSKFLNCNNSAIFWGTDFRLFCMEVHIDHPLKKLKNCYNSAIFTITPSK